MLSRRRRLLRYAGIGLALPWALWLMAGLFEGVPSMRDVFGIPGLKLPAAIAIAGLLIAAIGFWQD